MHAGHGKVDGHELTHEPEELKRRLGFMPDFCPVYDQLTAAEFLDHFARAYGVPNRAKSIEECLELTWLTEETRGALRGIVTRHETAAGAGQDAAARPSGVVAGRTGQRSGPARPHRIA